MAEQRGYDDRRGDVVELAVLLDDLLQAAGERRDDAIGEQHAKEGADQRRSDHAAKHGGRLVDRSHGLHHAKHRRDDTKRRKRVAQRLKHLHRLDRKSVVEGKSVSGRVDLGGRRINKKKKKYNKQSKKKQT